MYNFCNVEERFPEPMALSSSNTKNSSFDEERGFAPQIILEDTVYKQNQEINIYY